MNNPNQSRFWRFNPLLSQVRFLLYIWVRMVSQYDCALGRIKKRAPLQKAMKVLPCATGTFSGIALPTYRITKSLPTTRPRYGLESSRNFVGGLYTQIYRFTVHFKPPTV